MSRLTVALGEEPHEVRRHRLDAAVEAYHRWRDTLPLGRLRHLLRENSPHRMACASFLRVSDIINLKSTCRSLDTDSLGKLVFELAFKPGEVDDAQFADVLRRYRWPTSIKLPGMYGVTGITDGTVARIGCYAKALRSVTGYC